MTCDERKDLLLLYASDQLDPAEREALRAHLATGCPICAGHLAEAEATLALMASSIDPVSPPASAIDRLMAQIKTTPARASTPSRMRILPSLLAMAAAVAITSGIWFYVTRDARSFIRSNDLVTVALKSPTQPNAHGQVLWDRERQQWRVSVSNLGPTVNGREYELWLIPKDGKPIRSQTFQVDRDGKSTIVVPVPASVGELATAAITDEPLGGTDAPTGKVHLAGQFN